MDNGLYIYFLFFFYLHTPVRVRSKTRQQRSTASVSLSTTAAYCSCPNALQATRSDAAARQTPAHAALTAPETRHYPGRHGSRGEGPQQDLQRSPPTTPGTGEHWYRAEP